MKEVLDFGYVIAMLEAKGITGISAEDFKESKNMSVNNYVFFVNKRDVKIVLRVGHSEKDVPTYGKIEFVFGFIRKLFIPVPRTILRGIMKCSDGVKRPFLVQELVEAKDLFSVQNMHEYYPQVAEILAKLHQKEMKGFGHVVGKGNTFEGQHKKWFHYLFYEIRRSLDNLLSQGSIPQDKYTQYKNLFALLMRKYSYLIRKSPRRFMHGDIGPGNFLADEGEKKIKALLDVDYAAVGDPAWEFAGHRYINESLMVPYIDACKKVNPKFNADEFRLRIAIYDPIKKLVIASAWTKKDKAQIKSYFGEIDTMLGNLL
jgi:aminoglycoside phosphotransferase (APT) family kinase protein